jgi:hypothetical protein
MLVSKQVGFECLLRNSEDDLTYVSATLAKIKDNICYLRQVRSSLERKMKSKEEMSIYGGSIALTEH